MKTGSAKTVSRGKRVNLSLPDSLQSGSKPFFRALGMLVDLSFPHSVLGHGKRNRFHRKLPGFAGKQ